MAIAALVATFTVATPAHAYPPAGQNWFQLINEQTWDCLAVQTNTAHSGAIQTDCAHYNDQFFRFERVGQVEDTVYYRIRKYDPGYGSPMCLYANGTGPGARIKQYPCATYLDQQFNLIPRGFFDGYGYSHSLRNRNSLRCVNGNVGTNAVTQAGCANPDQYFPDQFWIVRYYF